MLKDAPKACESVMVVLDNCDVSLPIASKVPRGVQRENGRDLMGRCTAHRGEGDTGRHSVSRLPLCPTVLATPHRLCCDRRLTRPRRSGGVSRTG